MLKRILVGLAGQEYLTSAINQGIELAVRHDAELTGISVFDEAQAAAIGPVPAGMNRYAYEVLQQRVAAGHDKVSAEIDQFVEACNAMNVRYKVLREEGEHLSKFIEKSRYYDLMIFGLQGLFEENLVMDPQDALVRMVHAGVRPMIATARGFYPVKRALIAYSGSTESAKAMKRFIQLKIWPDLQLRIVTFNENKSTGRQLLEDAADYCRAHGYEPELECVESPPREQLLPYAESWGADITVIGNSAKNLMMRRLFGETALHAIRNSQRPLFLAQ